MKKRLYFGHPINVYSTPLEEALLAAIAAAFPDWEIVNPNRPEHDAGYERCKRETGNGMDYYTREVLPGCDGGIFLPFRDGAYGLGVFTEAKDIAAMGRPVWEIAAEGAIRALDLAAARVLTVAETRVRIRDASGARLPF